MAGKKIVIDWEKPETIQRAIELLEQRGAGFEEKVDRFLKEIAEIGRAAAAETYGRAVSVTVEARENGEYAIVAEGDPVVFFEFGAGAATDPSERYAKEMPFRVARGSYSDANGGMYRQTGYQFWRFGGRDYTEVRQKPGMLRAYEAIMQSIPETARKVFRDGTQ